MTKINATYFVVGTLGAGASLRQWWQPLVRQWQSSGGWGQWWLEVPGRQLVEALGWVASCHSIKDGCEA